MLEGLRELAAVIPGFLATPAAVFLQQWLGQQLRELRVRPKRGQALDGPASPLGPAWADLAEARGTVPDAHLALQHVDLFEALPFHFQH